MVASKKLCKGTIDLNGNILHLQRNGKKATPPQGNIDNLTYSYVGNQLHVVNDATADHAGEIGFKELAGKSFNAGNPSTWEYTYDANGNMIRDDNKGITAIVEMPQGIEKIINAGGTAKDVLQSLYEMSPTNARAQYLNIPDSFDPPFRELSDPGIPGMV